MAKSGNAPHFAGDNSRVYITQSVPGSDYPEQQLVSVDLNGENKREHLYGADKIALVLQAQLFLSNSYLTEQANI